MEPKFHVLLRNLTFTGAHLQKWRQEFFVPWAMSQGVLTSPGIGLIVQSCFILGKDALDLSGFGPGVLVHGCILLADLEKDFGGVYKYTKKSLLTYPKLCDKIELSWKGVGHAGS